MKKIFFYSIFLFLGCVSKKPVDTELNTYCFIDGVGTKRFQVNFDPSLNFNDSTYWDDFFKIFLKQRDSYQNFAFVDEKEFNGIIERKIVSIGSDFFIYLNNEVGPILVISPDFMFNDGVNCYLEKSTKYKTDQIDSLRDLCLKVYNGEGGLVKESR
jgi:hypothetical protein